MKTLTSKQGRIVTKRGQDGFVARFKFNTEGQIIASYDRQERDALISHTARMPITTWRYMEAYIDQGAEAKFLATLAIDFAEVKAELNAG